MSVTTTVQLEGKALLADDVAAYLDANGVPDAGVYIDRYGTCEITAAVDVTGLMADLVPEQVETRKERKARLKQETKQKAKKEGDLTGKEMSDILKTLIDEW